MEGIKLDLQDLAWQGVYLINVAQDIIDVQGIADMLMSPSVV